MADFQIKRMNWVRTPTAWQQTQQFKQKQQERNARMESLQASGSNLTSAAQNYIQQSGALAVQAAIKRNSDAAKAKAAEAMKQQADLKWKESLK